MPNRGRLTIKTECCNLAETTDDLQPGYYAVLTVADRGCGLRRCSSKPSALAAGKSTRPCHPEGLVAALGDRAAPGCCRTNCADGHCAGRLTGCARRSPLYRRDGPRLRRWRTFARLHQ